MNFPVILGIVLGGGTVLVGADYFIEFREQTTAPSGTSAQLDTATYLYECLGDPHPTLAFTAARSLCTPVDSFELKFYIYVNCNFFSVYRPNSRGQVIHLLDRGLMSHQNWYLGVWNHAIDHPNFAVPSGEDINHFTSEIREFWPITGSRPNLVPNLAFYYAQNNLIAYSRNPVAANSIFSGFVSLLRKLTGQYSSIIQESETNKLLYTTALKMALQKMIDPCSFLHGEFQTPASNHGAVYCNFINIAAVYFDTASSLGSVLQGGVCVGVVCMCVRLMNTPLVGYHTIPMQQCNNGLREKLNI